LTAGLTVKLDWLNVTFPAGRRDEVRELVSRHLGEAEYRPYGRQTYQESVAWPSSALLCWSEGRPEAWLSLNADSVDLVPAAELLPFLRALDELGAKGTRIDVALDDYDRRLSIDMVEAAFNAGHVVGFRLGHRQNPKRWADGKLESTGDGFDLGARGSKGSGKFVQFYDKSLESRGAVNAIRLEVRLSLERSTLAWECLVSSCSEESFHRKLREIVGGAIDFKSKPHETHVHRRPRLGWWQDLLDVLGSAVFVVHRPKVPLQRTMEYLRNTFSRKLSLARIVCQSLGHDLGEILDTWMDRAEPSIDWQAVGALHLGLNIPELSG
jgi:hypothetical protein